MRVGPPWSEQGPSVQLFLFPVINIKEEKVVTPQNLTLKIFIQASQQGVPLPHREKESVSDLLQAHAGLPFQTQAPGCDWRTLASPNWSP